mmetsp:Transcript_5029/g.20160  ORF Transcript_5029/g.20160 Transcript_5029/m.20160 type:complete len:247 (-) Transcript_5029:659-1399(-)
MAPKTSSAYLLYLLTARPRRRCRRCSPSARARRFPWRSGSAVSVAPRRRRRGARLNWRRFPRLFASAPTPGRAACSPPRAPQSPAPRVPPSWRSAPRPSRGARPASGAWWRGFRSSSKSRVERSCRTTAAASTSPERATTRKANALRGARSGPPSCPFRSCEAPLFAAASSSRVNGTRARRCSAFAASPPSGAGKKPREARRNRARVCAAPAGNSTFCVARPIRSARIPCSSWRRSWPSARASGSP